MQFAKLHALGNDFLIVRVDEGTGYQLPRAGLTRAICDRHTGVGADGALFFHPTVGDQDADFSTVIFNADGSRAEMSGNGVRCLAAFLCRAGLARSHAVRIRTVAGVRRATLRKEAGSLYMFEVEMGLPSTDPARLPARLGQPGVPVVGHPLDVGGAVVHVTLTSMGNPHCSTFWPSVGTAPVDTLGPLLERHESFPNRTNVEFIEVVDRHRLRARFWERGVGRTMSSGTGSSAAAVAAVLNDLAGGPVTVETELGSLEVDWEPGREVVLTGPAEYVCRGEYEVRETEAGG